jgi:hypothetical protein
MITSGGWITIDKGFVPVSGGVELSVTPTVKSKVPDVVGVPEKTPPAERVSPSGIAPAVTDHV